MTTATSYFRIKTESAPKTSLNAAGCIRYAVLRDAARADAYICLIGNDGGGYFSQEAVPFLAIKACLSGVDRERPIPAKTFRSAFRGQSVNNSGFLVAALRHEGLLLPKPDAAHQHMLGGQWDDWRKAMLAEAGEAFELPEVTKANAKAAAVISSAVEMPEAVLSKKSRKSPSGKRELPTVKTEEGEHAHPE